MGSEFFFYHCCCMYYVKNKHKPYILRGLITITLFVNVFLFSGFRSGTFQNVRQDVQIESQFDSQSKSEFQTFSFTGINSGNSVFILNIISAYSLFQLIDFNSRISSFIIQFSKVESLQIADLFFLPKTIPLCSEEAKYLTLIG